MLSKQLLRIGTSIGANIEESILQQAVAKLEDDDNEVNVNLHQVVAKIPWGHNMMK